MVGPGPVLLGDTPEHRIYCECKKCGHQASPTHQELIDKGARADCPIHHLTRFLKCPRCGWRKVYTMPLQSTKTMDEFRKEWEEIYRTNQEKRDEQSQ